MSTEADPLDQAALLSQQINDAYVQNARSKNKPEQVQHADGRWMFTECVDCDADLGDRKLLAKIRCVSCQTALERNKRFQR
jgi:RNA polymerase-binding transcription factor DksA